MKALGVSNVKEMASRVHCSLPAQAIPLVHVARGLSTSLHNRRLFSRERVARDIEGEVRALLNKLLLCSLPVDGI